MSKRQKQGMTRKEALAVFHKLQNAVGWHLYSEDASEEEKALREQVYTAFRVFDRAVHPTIATNYHTLCNFCYLRTSTRDTLAYVKGNRYYTDCCTECLTRLMAEKKLAYIEEWSGDGWVKKEVVE